MRPDLEVPLPVPDDAWRTRPAAQQPDWPSVSELRDAVRRLESLPVLVPAEECERLRLRMADVARGRSFLLQGGDCAETFDMITPEGVGATRGTLRSMAATLSDALAMPVVTMGRTAGQYAKPRSRSTETRGGVTLPVYRGDAVNGTEFTPEARTPDPGRLLRSRHVAAVTIGYLRELADEGDEFFVSHEGLLLDYEAALTRTDPRTGRRWAGSGHLLWIGERTRDLDGAHVEYFSTVDNPIAVKLGPTADADTVLRLADRLDPEREPGRLTFISRMGSRAVRHVLPELVSRVAAEGFPTAWVCDPMHGNTVAAPSGHKTRYFNTVMDEIRGFFEVHRTLDTVAGGLHLEMTGRDVTECVGGTGGVSADDLADRYESACDPRFNRAQSLEVAARVAELASKSPGPLRVSPTIYF
ncbi:3-deoxy-7-phosphoheptulonate synthase class II [Streptomyces sp. BE20]|uniref:3-deoxy-7-phosphoheptulonate synthase class II n=1 Tax=Streptomyces sp. BE20 TaxID=3002525 RepID=UPI002E75D348|nr:3-deoxy-7-phosphoheptulonate synthase class II [Streptomyces sp. BE20]MEE1828567.1 3-deoxy-7-phosphoheptulonate synthase class II [Streptomyces sp. BE20]